MKSTQLQQQKFYHLGRKQTEPDTLITQLPDTAVKTAGYKGHHKDFILINIRTTANSIPNKQNPMAL